MVEPLDEKTEAAAKLLEKELAEKASSTTSSAEIKKIEAETKTALAAVVTEAATAKENVLEVKEAVDAAQAQRAKEMQSGTPLGVAGQVTGEAQSVEVAADKSAEAMANAMKAATAIIQLDEASTKLHSSENALEVKSATTDVDEDNTASSSARGVQEDAKVISEKIEAAEQDRAAQLDQNLATAEAAAKEIGDTEQEKLVSTVRDDARELAKTSEDVSVCVCVCVGGANATPAPFALFPELTRFLWRVRSLSFLSFSPLTCHHRVLSFSFSFSLPSPTLRRRPNMTNRCKWRKTRQTRRPRRS